MLLAIDSATERVSLALHDGGEVLAERARQQGVTRVVFDRGGFQFHGRVKALADGSRAQGLQF